MPVVKVIVRFRDGRMIKGNTNDFFANKPLFHVSTNNTDKGTPVEVRDLKAVFFVKEFGGNPAYNDLKDFPQGPSSSGRKVEVIFKDGETLVGTTLGYDPSRPGFFLSPADPGSNNLRVYVVSSAVEKFRYL